MYELLAKNMLKSAFDPYFMLGNLVFLDIPVRRIDGKRGIEAYQ